MTAIPLCLLSCVGASPPTANKQPFHEPARVQALRRRHLIPCPLVMKSTHLRQREQLCVDEVVQRRIQAVGEVGVPQVPLEYRRHVTQLRDEVEQAWGSSRDGGGIEAMAGCGAQGLVRLRFCPGAGCCAGRWASDPGQGSLNTHAVSVYCWCVSLRHRATCSVHEGWGPATPRAKPTYRLAAESRRGLKIPG
jgi:hypothetical protein